MPIKSVEQQARLMMHRARQGFVEQRTATLKLQSGRPLSAWLGLAPGHYSSGGKTRLGRITKTGDPCLRSLLVMGARAVLNAAKGKSDSVSRWAVQLAERRGCRRAIVAIVAKNARMAWAVLSRGDRFVMPT